MKRNLQYQFSGAATVPATKFIEAVAFCQGIGIPQIRAELRDDGFHDFFVEDNNPEHVLAFEQRYK